MRLLDYFYYKEHLVIVTELLRDNLYEFSTYNRESGDEPFFTLGNIRRIAHQVLTGLVALHSVNIIHCDLKPENILIESYRHCTVKIIDFGSSCFTTDHLANYIQSRSYRAPEVILGLPYGPNIDVWSLGCVLAELWTGDVLFHNTSLPTMLARIIGVVGELPAYMMEDGKYSAKYFTRSGYLYEERPCSSSRAVQQREQDGEEGDSEEEEGSGAEGGDEVEIALLHPKKTSIAHRLRAPMPEFIDFMSHLLQPDPKKVCTMLAFSPSVCVFLYFPLTLPIRTQRVSAADALQHPWLNQ